MNAGFSFEIMNNQSQSDESDGTAFKNRLSMIYRKQTEDRIEKIHKPDILNAAMTEYSFSALPDQVGGS